MNRRQFIAVTLASSFALATERKLRVAVIGHTGRGNYEHSLDTMWRALSETEVVAVADADPKELAAASTSTSTIGPDSGSHGNHELAIARLASVSFSLYV